MRIKSFIEIHYHFFDKSDIIALKLLMYLTSGSYGMGVFCILVDEFSKGCLFLLLYRPNSGDAEALANGLYFRFIGPVV